MAEKLGCDLTKKEIAIKNNLIDIGWQQSGPRLLNKGKHYSITKDASAAKRGKWIVISEYTQLCFIKKTMQDAINTVDRLMRGNS